MEYKLETSRYMAMDYSVVKIEAVYIIYKRIVEYRC